jgi:hypothetical protein
MIEAEISMEKKTHGSLSSHLEAMTFANKKNSHLQMQW